MRLSMEEVQKIKDDYMYFRLMNELWDKRLIDMFDTIEAQQQEIEQLKKAVGEWKYEAECHMDEVIASKKENEEQRAQAAAMRELILELKPSCGTCNPENCTEDCGNLRRFEMIDAALSSEAGKDYHNPADVEALKLVREVLEMAVAWLTQTPEGKSVPQVNGQPGEWMRMAQAAIEKALGGNEDGV